MITLPNRPQSYTEIFGTAFLIMKGTFSKAFPLFFLVVLISYALQPLGKWIETSNKANELGMALVGILALLILLFFTYAFFGGAIFRMHSVIKKTDPGFGEALGFGSRKVIPLVVVAILYTVAIGLGLVLLIIPGIILAIYFVFTIYLIYLDFSILDTFKESYRLVKDHWWRMTINIALLTLAIFVFALLFVGLLIALAVGFEVMFAAIIPNYQSNSAHAEMVMMTILTIPTLFVMALIYNYAIAFMLTCLYDLQLRHTL